MTKLACAVHSPHISFVMVLAGRANGGHRGHHFFWRHLGHLVHLVLGDAVVMVVLGSGGDEERERGSGECAGAEGDE
ncbi:MAG: hypothetical protein NXI07_03535 [bacterium]|nr:hypothetical protein [bacterium]